MPTPLTSLTMPSTCWSTNPERQAVAGIPARRRPGRLSSHIAVNTFSSSSAARSGPRRAVALCAPLAPLPAPLSSRPLSQGPGPRTPPTQYRPLCLLAHRRLNRRPASQRSGTGTGRRDVSMTKPARTHLPSTAAPTPRTSWRIGPRLRAARPSSYAGAARRTSSWRGNGIGIAVSMVYTHRRRIACPALWSQAPPGVSGAPNVTEGTGPGLTSPPRPPPAPGGMVGGGGCARRREWAHAHVLAGPGRRRLQDPPGRGPVQLERLEQLQARGGRISPHRFPIRRQRSGSRLDHSCRRRPHHSPAGRRGRRRRGPPTGRRPSDGGQSARRLATRRRRRTISRRRGRPTGCTSRLRSWHGPCGHSWPP